MTTQFDYLREQLSGNTWIGKEVFKVPEFMGEAIGSGRDWYMNLPHIKFIMENPAMGGVKNLLTASQDLAGTVVDCNLVFLETVHGINRAYNSKLYKDLAGKGQNTLAKLSASNTEKAIYEASVSAHNESLNLPQLSVKVAAIESEIAAIQQQASGNIQQWKTEAIASLEGFKNELLLLIQGLTGNAKSNANRKLKIAEAGLTPMKTGVIPSIIAQNPYEISSVYRRGPISSIYQRQPVYASAIVPIAAGGAATVAATAGVLAGITEVKMQTNGSG